jgi:hypothetical protein
MPNGDRVFANDHLFDQQADDPLSFCDVERFCGGT